MRRRTVAAAVAVLVAGAAAITFADRGDEAGQLVRCGTVRYTPAGAPARLGDLCAPTSPRDRVAVVVIHGGGGFEGDRRSSAAWSHLFREAGYLTLSVDYALHDETTPPPFFPAPYRDVKTAVQWLRRHAERLAIDADRIVVQGISYGATLAGSLLVTSGDDELAGAWSGTGDRVAGMIGLYGYYDGHQLHPDVFYGGPRDSPDLAVADRWALADSIARADGASGPALLVHGDADWVIPVEHTARFAAALEDAGVEVELEIAEGLGHGFDRPGGPTLSDDGERIARRVLRWLERHFGA